MSGTHIALISGGKDSAVAAHYSMTEGPCEALMYLDTGTGLQENEEYLNDFADEFGWHLIKWRTPENYEELVEKYGFPGPSKHVWFYQYLKERQLSKLAGWTDAHFWTGVHKAESDNRMAVVTEEQADQSGRWTWHAPCADWKPSDFDQYREKHDIPENPLWTKIGRSGDCYCGAYANRMELLDLDAIDSERAEWLREIETGVDAERCGFDDPRRSEWAWHDDDKSAWAMEDVQNDEQMMLCDHCTPDYPTGESQ
jgi:3'-phosphoadenosine 5'-phosphosulfate sulfotransferase (PAPS reductase)/FAD synthetase